MALDNMTVGTDLRLLAQPDGLGYLQGLRSADATLHSALRADLARAVVPALDGVSQVIGRRLTIWAWSRIDCAWANAAVAALVQWPNAQAVLVRINSQGGLVGAAEFFAKHLAQHRARTIAIVDRHCHSAATIVAAACGLTWARAGSDWMLHPVVTAIDGTAAELSAAAFDARQTDGRIAHRIARCRGVPFDVVRELREAGRYVDAVELVEIGLADRVIHALPAVTEGACDAVADTASGR